MAEQPLKILIVDDSALYRQTIATVLRGIEGVEVVGTAQDGQQAIERIETLSPDLLTLDVEMPVMNGIETLREMNRRRHSARAIMVSTLTEVGAKVTLDALFEGAFDFIRKPSGGLIQSREQLRSALCEKLAAFRVNLKTRNEVPNLEAARMPIASPLKGETNKQDTIRPSTQSCEAVLIGLSTGGPKALNHVIPRLDAEFPTPIIIVQHMPADYTKMMARRLDDHSELHVLEAETGRLLEAGTVYLAPGGQHLDLVVRAGGVHTELTMDPPMNSCRPSVDYTIGRAVDAWGGNLLAVIMTGMGKDGLEGCRRLHQEGGTVFAQDAASSAVYGMPKAVTEAGITDRSLPLSRIAPAITRHVNRHLARRTKS